VIGQYCFALRSADGAPIPSMMAYRLYGWLLEQLPEDIGRQLHEQGEKPLSQYIRYDKAENRTLWVVSVFQGELYELLEPVLESISCIALRQTTLQDALLDKRCFASAQEFVLYARELRLPSRVTIRFHTTSSFKQDGSYVIFPQERLLLRSLLAKWSAWFPEYSLDDEDAAAALERGVRITDYQLRSGRYTLKSARIPGFSGHLTLSSSLSAPMQEVRNLLLVFSTLCGIGIKTTLGMGGVTLEISPNSLLKEQEK
jgi:CRISPR-associated endoribonuclease Cas6